MTLKKYSGKFTSAESEKMDIAIKMVHKCTLEEMRKAEKIFVNKLPEEVQRKDQIALVGDHYVVIE